MLQRSFYLLSLVAILFLGPEPGLGAPGYSPLTLLSPVAAKPTAPDFTLPDSEGQSVKLSDLRGKVIVLNFWATWCPPCREEMPSMQTLWESFKGKDFELLAVNVGEDEDMVFAFRHELSKALKFPILLDQQSQVARMYPIRGLPTTYVLDKQGRIVYQAVGGRDWNSDEIKQLLRELIGPGTKAI